MQALREQKQEAFDQLGLEVVNGTVEVGQTYPMFGMITKILDRSAEKIQLEINFQIIANVLIDDESRFETLRDRMFESGIFVAKVVNTEPVIEVNCETIIFGRRQELQA